MAGIQNVPKQNFQDSKRSSLDTFVCISLGISPFFVLNGQISHYCFTIQKCQHALAITTQFLALTGPLKWGTVWAWISIGIETMHGQS